MPADRPACHYSTNATWDTFSSPYWRQTEQTRVSRWQTLTLVWNDFAVAYFHIPYSLTFCKWQLVINWHHGSVCAPCTRHRAEREQDAFLLSKTSHGRLQVNQLSSLNSHSIKKKKLTANKTKKTTHTQVFNRSFYEKLDPNMSKRAL